MAASGRTSASRESRRTSQFAKFKQLQLNLIPLVDVFVSLVFFTLITMSAATVPIVQGVRLPEAEVGIEAISQLTVGIGSRPAEVSVGGQSVMSVAEAAAARSDDPNRPLVIPKLLSVLNQHADSLRRLTDLPRDSAVQNQLAIHADRTLRYDVLARVMQTARSAGFRNISLQVLRAGVEEGAATRIAAPQAN